MVFEIVRNWELPWARGGPGHRKENIPALGGCPGESVLDSKRAYLCFRGEMLGKTPEINTGVLLGHDFGGF